MDRRPPRRARFAFSLVELLIAIAILALLAALLFPAYARARGQARAVACASNMRQAGMAFAMYAQDYDGLYPYAKDPADAYTPQIWNAYPEFKAQIPTMAWVHEALGPYVKARDLFHCPSDSGIAIEDFTGQVLNGTPTMYGKFGTSYLYRTEIAFRHAGDAGFPDACPTQCLHGRLRTVAWHRSVGSEYRRKPLFRRQHHAFRAAFQHTARRRACKESYLFAGLETMAHATLGS